MITIPELLREARLNVDAAIAKYGATGPSEAVFANVAGRCLAAAQGRGPAARAAGETAGGGEVSINGSAYARSRQDPRWQEMRLRVFNRDGWACRCCTRTDLELHAHHSYYEHGREPWDYPLDSIVTYCHNCHEAEHGRSFAGDAAVLQLLRKAGFPLLDDRLALAASFHGVGTALSPNEARELAFMVGVLAWVPRLAVGQGAPTLQRIRARPAAL